MRKSKESIQVFKARRERLKEQIMGSALIVAAAPEHTRIGNLPLPYRPDPNLYYLTGFEEPESILVFRPGRTPETVMFVREKNVERETWDGFRFGIEGTQSEFGIEKVYPIQEFEKMAPELLKGVEALYYRRFKNDDADTKVDRVLKTMKASTGRTGLGFLPIHDADALLGEFRVIKGDLDLMNLRKACDLSAEAHLETMKYTRPGMNEKELHGFFMYQVMKNGGFWEGYNGIFASGANATTLHYVFNDETLKAGELMLIDAAGQFNYFTSDITRTYPISGRFNQEQAEVYEGVLKVQKELIEMVKPGLPYQALHDTGTSLLTELMLELGLLTGRKEDIIQALEHKKYYPHGIGHFLGMDVHDVGLYINPKTGEPRLLEENMVFTIEPGIYIPANDSSVAKEYRGIGVRIEDNIRVTRNGFEVLTAKAPKEMADLEKIVGT
jgi:Xaa-Pro aminopeptidase